MVGEVGGLTGRKELFDLFRVMLLLFAVVVEASVDVLSCPTVAAAQLLASLEQGLLVVERRLQLAGGCLELVLFLADTTS